MLDERPFSPYVNQLLDLLSRWERLPAFWEEALVYLNPLLGRDSIYRCFSLSPEAFLRAERVQRR